MENGVGSCVSCAVFTRMNVWNFNILWMKDRENDEQHKHPTSTTFKLAVNGVSACCVNLKCDKGVFCYLAPHMVMTEMLVMSHGIRSPALLETSSPGCMAGRTRCWLEDLFRYFRGKHADLVVHKSREPALAVTLSAEERGGRKTRIDPTRPSSIFCFLTYSLSSSWASLSLL